MAQVSSVRFVKPGTQELLRLNLEEKRGLTHEEQVKVMNERVEKELARKIVEKSEMMSLLLFGG